MNRVVRVLSVATTAAVCVTCADQAVANGRVGFARIPLAPSFVVAPAGGPNIPIDRIRGVLRSATDSTVVVAKVFGDSAILEFENVVVRGDSTKFQLGVEAIDRNNIVVFSGEQDLQVRPGNNAPANPTLDYTAPDAIAASIDISVVALALNWAGGDTSATVNRECLSRSPSPTTSNTTRQLTVSGMTSNNVVVAGVRVGWTSRDNTVFTVDSAGLVKARCSSKSAYLVARTFLDKADSILVTVTAPPFSLLMSPDSASVQRGSTRQLTALVVDENGNTVPAASVTWTSSDTTRARVNATGLVTAISNGRVIITAGSGGRTTVGVVQVVRPSASSVVVQPAVALDSLGVGQLRAYFAKALDAANRVIPDATGFAWSSSAPSVVTVNSSTGVARALATGGASVTATLDGRQASVALSVLTSLPPGGIKGKVTDAATGLALSGAVVSSSASNTVTTLADGSFTLGNLQNGDDITVTRTGYVPITAYSVPAFPNKTLEVPGVPMSPTGSTGTITGKVVNALSGSTVSGINVTAYTGVNGGPTLKRPIVTPALPTTTTNASGVFTFSGAPAGVYTLLFNGTGYSDAISGASSVSGTTKTTADVLLPPAAVGGGLYIVLTWGDCTSPNVPCDLDAHLTGPKVAPDTGRFQVFSASKSYFLAPDTIAALDVDDNNSRGPEIIGLRPSAGVGLYRFYVHNFSGAAAPTGKALADSAAARVDVYQDSRLIGTFFPPSNVAGTLWNVFDYDGARLIPVGTMSPSLPNPLALRASEVKKRHQ